MSQLHREGRFDGVERADSLTWNPHKLLGALLQCATFHLKEKVRPPSREKPNRYRERSPAIILEQQERLTFARMILSSK